MQSYDTIDPDDPAPLATAFDKAGVEWIGNIIAVGATIGLTVVVMILMMGQTRVAFAMARDGLLPTALAKVHPTFGTPYRITLITGLGVALLSGFVDLATLGDLVSIGTLFAFVLVASACWCFDVRVPTFRARSVRPPCRSWPCSRCCCAST